MIIDEDPINPKYYEKMSELLDVLIEERWVQVLDTRVLGGDDTALVESIFEIVKAQNEY